MGYFRGIGSAPFTVLVLIVTAAAAAGCGPRIGPAPVFYKGASTGGGRPPAVLRTPVARPRVDGTVGVAKGDTLYGIARRHGVPLRSVIEANGLRPPYTLAVGQRLLLPAARAHVVRRGETVYAISRRYGVDRSALVRANGIRPPYTIRAGQRLVLPATTVRRAVSSPATEEARRRPRPATKRRTGRLAAVPRAPPRSGRSFLWPLKGRVIIGFGPQGGGFHNDGINIAAPRGAPVRAAENGVVVYAGDDLKGFGNLLLIRHAGGWMTAYAHNDALLVRRGELVKRAQTIARAGSTGRVSTPQIHFEIRRGVRAVDPRDYLPGGRKAEYGGAAFSRAAFPSGPPGPG
jgi:murein DD-endopeptidase MepM/ murein hydrolase activator NlpD